jgi:phage terminase large subunit-like protein
VLSWTNLLRQSEPAGVEYFSNGSVLVSTRGQVVEVGLDYAMVDDGSGEAKVFFMHGATMPNLRTGTIWS